MQKQNNSVSQKIKDRIFYVALIVGVVAIFSVVAVYTMGQDGGRLAQQEQDVNTLSEYAYDEDATEQKKAMEFSVESNTKDVIANSETKKELSTDYRPLELDEASLEQDDDDTKALSEETKAEEEVAVNDVKEKDGEGAVTADTSKTEERTVPVVAEAEALNFNSESTISWPIEGKVMIPFSMETTVYFKTLDQYRCNPGMLIAAGVGSTVKNAYMGKVTKVTSDNDYGNMVTVYLGNDYSVVYGQLDTIYVKEGDYVKAGDSIGTIGKPTDTFAEEGSHLYFKMMQGEEAVDPALYME